MDPARFVFLDETGASTNMVRRYGWGPRDERLVDAAPHGHWKTTTFVAGLRSTGFVAPLVLDGPMTGDVARQSGCELRDNQDERLWSRWVDDCRGASLRASGFRGGATIRMRF
jgi:hypothetical protein